MPRIYWLKDLIAIASFFVIVILLQSRDSVYDSEFGGHPDEAAHYVTGLMVRDYLASGFHTAPMAYAKDYYDHYPKVALGNWPPMFYLMQAAWTLPFGVSSNSILLFMAALAALLAWVLFRILAACSSVPLAAVGTVVFLELPLVRLHFGMVMTEIPVALFAFLAVIYFGRFLDREARADAIMFGILSGVAIMTKGSALALAFVPPLAIVLTRKFHLLRRPALWVSALLVALIAGPWTVKFRETAKAGWMEDNPSWHFTREALKYYPVKLVLSVGFILFILAMVGAVLKFHQSRTTGQPGGRRAAFISAVIGVVVLQSVVPAGYEPRHLVQALPPLFCLSIAGFAPVAAWIGRHFHGPRALIVPCLLLLVIGAEADAYRHAAKLCFGFRPLAEKILQDPASANAVLFVSSDARGEGQFISEIAMREQRPGHVVQRASKVLASSTWGGDKYTARAGDAAGVIRLLEGKKIGIIVVDEAFAEHRQPHHELLQRAVREFPNRFHLIGKGVSVRDADVRPDGIKVYRLVP